MNICRAGLVRCTDTPTDPQSMCLYYTQHPSITGALTMWFHTG